jgi:hypothetical protein
MACGEGGCDDLVDCEICQTCHRHCIAVPNHKASHRANLDKVLAKFVQRRQGLLN